jgi:CHAD domain-containing protein
VKKIKKKYLSSIFRKLDRKNIEELDSYFITNLLSLDALRIILYKYSLSILFYKERILLYDDDEDLHQFRINIRKSRAFLKEFDFLFPKKYHIYFYENLTSFATQTNQKRDLDVIKKRLQQLDEKHDTIQEKIKQQQVHEQQLIQEMLRSQTFKNFFLSYQDTLKGERLFTVDNNKETIEYTTKKVIKGLHLKIIKKITALEKDYDDKKLHKIRISFKKLRYLLEEFQHIFGERKIKKMIEKGKKLQTLLGDINDTINQTELLHKYFQSNTTNLSEGI